METKYENPMQRATCGELLFARRREGDKTMADIFELFKQIEKKRETASAAPTHIIAGLGNPGKEYERTRHNAGFHALDYLSDVLGVSVNRAKFSALCADAQLGPYRVLLMKPQTYMNASGDAIRAAADFYKIPPENILVLVDDIYQDAGRMRVRLDGSHGGHNGLKSIEAQIGAKYPRIRFGVGQKPSPQYDLAAWVLGKMQKEDIAGLVSCFPLVKDAAEKIFDGKADTAMGMCNGHRPPDTGSEKSR